MQKMPQISVIIPSHNRERYVVKAIDSVLNQTFRDYEIIVIDDGSTDGTQKALEVYSNKISYIYQENSGVSSARNTGVKLATGEWLAFLDSDDEWRVDYLSTQINRASEIPGLCMQTTNSLFIALNGKTRSYFDINGSLTEFNGKDYLFLKEPFLFVVKHGPWPFCSTIIHRDAVAKAGLFDTSLKISEDFDLMARVALHGSFGMIRENLVDIYRREESIDSLTTQARENPIQARESDEKIYEKLRKIETLQYRERKALNGLLGANRRARGNLLLKAGNINAARDCYRRALLVDPSIASLGKYALSFLPSRITLWIFEKYADINTRKKIGE
jgi:glycosyltransferase involved in cell wall biosynthesis